MTEALTAKQVRSTHSALQGSQSALEQHAALLHRLYYKSKAQHRSAKWFQSLDGVRKCFRRLLSDMEGGEGGFITSASRYTCAIEVEASLPNRAGHAERRARNVRRNAPSKSIASSTVKRPALFRGASVALTDTWCSFWDIQGSGMSMLPRVDRPPTSSPSEGSLQTTVLQLFRLIIALEELIRRTELSFALLTAQLRTPPAPTFAALVATLCALMAAINHATQTILWGSIEGYLESSNEQVDAIETPSQISLRPDDAIAVHYMQLCQSLKGYDPSNIAVIDSRTREQKQAFNRFSNNIQHADVGKNRVHSWLPHVLKRSRDPEQLLQHNNKKDLVQVAFDPITIDEDLGEAV